MSLKNHNRQFLRSEGKGQDARNLKQMRIYKPMPSLVNQPSLFACCAAGLFHTSQGVGFVSVFVMKSSSNKERKGKETERVQIYSGGTDTVMHEGLDPARNARGSGTVQTLCQCGSLILGAQCTPPQLLQSRHGQCGLAQLRAKGWRAR